MSSLRTVGASVVATAFIACTGNGPAGGVNAVVPYQPSGVVAVPGDSLVAVSWLVPVQSQSATERNVIIQYTVTSSPDATHPNGVTANCAGDIFGATVTGLTNGVTYTFTVVATNHAGNSEVSPPSNPATPSGVPGAPTGIFTVGAGEDSASVTWTPPANTGGSQIIGYNVTATPMGVAAGQVFTVGGTMTTALISNLSDAISYTFTVTAENDIGIGPSSETSNAVTTVFPPGPVTNVTAAAEVDGGVNLYWTPPGDNGGSFIANYNIYTLVEGAMTNTIETDGMTPGYDFTFPDGMTYTFEVTATNLAGSSEPAYSNAVTTAMNPQ